MSGGPYPAALAVATILFLIAMPSAGIPLAPPVLGPDAGTGLDAPNDSSRGLLIGSGTESGVLSSTTDRDWYRVVTFAHTTGIKVQFFGVTQCVVVQVVFSPLVGPNVPISSILCPGPGAQVRYDLAQPGPGVWSLGVLSGYAETSYSLHVQVYGGL